MSTHVDGTTPTGGSYLQVSSASALPKVPEEGHGAVNHQAYQRRHSNRGGAIHLAMREAILTLCRATVSYQGHVEVDGIICISGPEDGQQIVVKVHEQLPTDPSSLKRHRTHGDDDSHQNGDDEEGDDADYSGSIASKRWRRHSSNSSTAARHLGSSGEGRGQRSSSGNMHKNSSIDIKNASDGFKSSYHDVSSLCSPEEGTATRSSKESLMLSNNNNNVNKNDCRTDYRDGSYELSRHLKDRETKLESIVPYIKQESACSTPRTEPPMRPSFSPAEEFSEIELKRNEEGGQSHARTPTTPGSISGELHSSALDLSTRMGSLSRTPSEEENSIADSMGSLHRSGSGMDMEFGHLGSSFSHYMEPTTPPASASTPLQGLGNIMPYMSRRPVFPSPLAPSTVSLSQSSTECKACGMVIADTEQLQEHNETHHCVYTCRVCFKTFTSRSNLDRHARLHTGHKPYVCTKCGKAFSRKDHLTNHSAKHAYKCNKCLKRFVDRDELKCHYQAEHGTELVCVCTHCNKGFTDARVFAEHSKSHPENFTSKLSPTQPISLPSPSQQQQQARASSPLSPHLQTSQQRHPSISLSWPKKYRYRCNDCNLNCSDAAELAQHRTIHHAMLPCASCGEEFSKPELYVAHLQSHQIQGHLECPHCNQKCSTYQELSLHMQAHHDLYSSAIKNLAKQKEAGRQYSPSATSSSAVHVPLTEREYPGDAETYLCPYCAVSFPTEEVLMEHVRLHESNLNEKQSCDECGEQFNSQPALAMHLEQEHGDMRSEVAQEAPSSGRNQSASPSSETGGSAAAAAAAQSSSKPGATAERSASTHSRSSTKNSSESSEEISELKSPTTPAALDSSFQRYNFSVSETPSSMTEEISPRSSGSTERPTSSPMKHSLVDEAEENSQESSGHSLQRQDSSAGGNGSRLGEDCPPDGTGVDSSWFSIKNHNNSYVVPIPTGMFPCSICGRELESFKTYEGHCFSSHYRYPCMYCPKTFAQRPNRDRHVCIHTGEKPFSCPECDEKFTRGDKLKLHRMKVHNLEYPGPYVRLQTTAMPQRVAVTTAGMGNAALGGLGDTSPPSTSATAAAAATLAGLHLQSGVRGAAPLGAHPTPTSAAMAALGIHPSSIALLPGLGPRLP